VPSTNRYASASLRNGFFTCALLPPALALTQIK